MRELSEAQLMGRLTELDVYCQLVKGQIDHINAERDRLNGQADGFLAQLHRYKAEAKVVQTELARRRPRVPAQTLSPTGIESQETVKGF